MKKELFNTCILLLFSLSMIGQSLDFVKDYGITSDLHQKHIGAITFMAGYIPLSDYKETDFLNRVTLNKKTALNIRTFLPNSLTNYLHLLAPKLSSEELVQQGNYQFTFLVDGNPVYTENLNQGAGTTETKNKYTTLAVPLISPKKADSWGRFLWSRFMMKGGQQALSAGNHILEIEIRPYVALEEVVVGEMIAKGTLEISSPEKKIKEKAIAIQEVSPTKDWPIGTDNYNQEIIRDLNRGIATNDFKKISSVVVIKNKELLIEEYFNGAKRNTLHDTRSVGKSFASALTGIAIDQGWIKNEQQTLGEFYDLTTSANYTIAKAEISIQNLLTMSSTFDGFDFDPETPGTEDKMQATKNWVQFTLDLPLDDKKTNGGQWNYFTAGCGLVGDILDRQVPGGLEKFAEGALFTPMNIAQHKWHYTPQGKVYAGGGLRLTALDLAKFGQLYKNKGQWKGKQIISSAWVQKSLSPHIELPEGGNGAYGYLFWNHSFEANGEKYDAYLASGNGGNKIIIFQDLPIVMVITAKAYNEDYMHPQVQQMVERYLLPAVLDQQESN